MEKVSIKRIVALLMLLCCLLPVISYAVQPTFPQIYPGWACCGLNQHIKRVEGPTEWTKKSNALHARTWTGVYECKHCKKLYYYQMQETGAHVCGSRVSLGHLAGTYKHQYSCWCSVCHCFYTVTETCKRPWCIGNATPQ